MNFWNKIINVFHSRTKHSEPESVHLESSDIENFYAQLDDSCKGFIDYHDIIPISFENMIIFTFYDLEDGNYFAVDRDGNAYSCIHDARPFIVKMNMKAKELIECIQNKTFNIQEHFEVRYKA